ncbi:hypothetical protein ACSX1A_16980 [Pontibacter sp. MBLB2868]|uniref:hypothetical protein n=1 Tax=Pontibacter sp. MBLB2868 TaxID=3451555 RepID=UPI003F755568
MKSRSRSMINYRNSIAAIHFSYKLALWAVLALVVILLWGAGQPKGNIEPLVLRTEPMPFTPKEFYIAEIVDERSNREAVAYLLPLPTTASPATSTLPVDLQGGGLTAIRQYVNKSLKQDTKLRPIVVRLKEVQLKESAGAKGRVNGTVAVHMAFDLMQRESEQIPLIEFRGGARYSRPASQHDVVEPTLRQSLVAGLQYFNTWIDQEANRNELFAKAIKVSFQDYIPHEAGDTVFYGARRLLNWADFTGAPNASSKYAAAVFPGFSYEGQSEVVDGVIDLKLLMKVFVVKSASWVKGAARDAYSLNHEQRHFDIVKLVAERFKQKIQPDSLDLADYNSIIQYQYIESFREMNRLQDQYDNETRHGIDQVAQQRWNQRIDAEFKELGLKQ